MFRIAVILGLISGVARADSARGGAEAREERTLPARVLAVEAEPRVVVAHKTSRIPDVLFGLGVASLAVGVAYHFIAVVPARDALSGAPDGATYDRLEPRFDNRRVALFGFYGAGAVLTIIAVGWEL